MTPSKPRTPTPQGISALLRKAGYNRAELHERGGARSGYRVTLDHAHAYRVRVRHASLLMGMNAQRKDMLARYAAAIEAAGWTVEAAEYELIVTAKAEEG